QFVVRVVAGHLAELGDALLELTHGNRGVGAARGFARKAASGGGGPDHFDGSNALPSKTLTRKLISYCLLVSLSVAFRTTTYSPATFSGRGRSQSMAWSSSLTPDFTS